MKASKEFVVGKHKIGWVSSFFEERFKDTEFKKCAIPTFQKLPRRMTNTKIESELKPGLCELGDVLAFLDTPPKECKDGNWNLFYLPECVVHVYWHAVYGVWDVNAWPRDAYGWREGHRIFSPATEHSALRPLNSDALTLVSEIEERFERLKKILQA